MKAGLFSMAFGVLALQHDFAVFFIQNNHLEIVLVDERAVPLIAKWFASQCHDEPVSRIESTSTELHQWTGVDVCGRMRY